MVDIGRSTGEVATATVRRASLARRFNDGFDAMFDATTDALTRWLCRASRGYLCPPDMTSVMYPDEPGSAKVRIKECCNEKLPRK